MVALGRGWTVGSTLRLTSGKPETADRRPDLRRRSRTSYRPVYGDVNSDRNAAVPPARPACREAMAARVGQRRRYLDVQNAYNARHVEGRHLETTTTRARRSPYGLPILPSSAFAASSSSKGTPSCHARSSRSPSSRAAPTMTSSRGRFSIVRGSSGAGLGGRRTDARVAPAGRTGSRDLDRRRGPHDDAPIVVDARGVRGNVVGCTAEPVRHRTGRGP